jgi:hypothetical protein
MTIYKSQYIRRWVLSGVGVALLAMAHSSSAVCLLKSHQAESGGLAYTLMVAPAGEVTDFASRGFVPVACPPDMSVVRAYVERLCATPGQGSVPAVNTEVLLGLPRERVCASARAGLAETGR